MLVNGASCKAPGRHERFFQEEFERQISSRNDLAKAIDRAVTAFVADLTSIGNQMFVDILGLPDTQTNHSLISTLRSPNNE
jgi:hypothetical protein